MLMQQHKSSRAVEIIDFRAGGWDSRIPCEGSITFHQHVNEHTKYTCKRTHVSADGHKHAHTHRAFVLLPQPFPLVSRADWWEGVEEA